MDAGRKIEYREEMAGVLDDRSTEDGADGDSLGEREETRW